MLEILQLIFSSFWVWFGTVVLIIVTGTALAAVVLAFRGKDS
jgi:ABC-type Fe3+ transport system permease subunit